MYWLPILEKNKKSLVYFELTEERNSYSKINITFLIFLIMNNPNRCELIFHSDFGLYFPDN